ncbi:putative L-aspartate dehydrogenase [Motacilla alba alba]|uniref:putative L-aspartate dehydrogenase n=1 Tax=Motacilla alba alba TaxID=1094192 RepID=UPI0018D4DB91|nr:putative L-aspartate dehydrogenase [Motacilla alba alba]
MPPPSPRRATATVPPPPPRPSGEQCHCCHHHCVTIVTTATCTVPPLSPPLSPSLRHHCHHRHLHCATIVTITVTIAVSPLSPPPPPLRPLHCAEGDDDSDSDSDSDNDNDSVPVSPGAEVTVSPLCPQALKVTMTKAPGSFRARGWLSPRVAAAVASGTRTVLYRGPLRPLCPLVPNNVNSLAAAAVAAPRLGFDGVTACLVADPSVPNCHIIDVEVTAVPERGRSLTVTSSRRNPAEPGHVTGSATRHSFWSSVQACTGHGGCVKLC